MNHAKIIVKNSIWLIIQPFILNVISLFVIGYIARALGEADYGKFVFAFAFITIFSPFANFGLHQVAVRAIAQDKKQTGVFIGKIVALRFLLSLLTLAAIVIIINLMKYPAATKAIVYMASSTVVFFTIASTFQDVFQAHQKMEYIAYSEFISGLILTILSVFVLYMGHRLTGITLVYCFGGFLGMLMTVWFLLKKFTIPVFKIDFLFWKQSLYKGAPFFFPGLLVIFGSKIGIILLSKMSGDVSVGVYGAAYSLIEKLLIIPDSVCTAFFPAMSSLFKDSAENAKHLFRRFFMYLFLVGLFIAVNTTIFAKQIVCLVYGAKYASSIIILQALSWWLFLSFLTYIQSWTLAAIHQEKKGAMARFITIPLYILLNLLLIPYLKEKGVVVSALIIAILHFIILHNFLKVYFLNIFSSGRIFLKITSVNIAVCAVTIFLNRCHFVLAIISSVILYMFLLLKFKIIRQSDFSYLKFFLKEEPVKDFA